MKTNEEKLKLSFDATNSDNKQSKKQLNEIKIKILQKRIKLMPKKQTLLKSKNIITLIF